MRRVPVICQCRSEKSNQCNEADAARNLQARIDRFKAYSLMDERFEKSTFENWMHVPDKEVYYEFGIRYCENWSDMLAGNHGFLFHGKAGTGKTYLTFAIANKLYKQGTSVMAISVSKILSVIRDSFDKNGYLGETEI